MSLITDFPFNAYMADLKTRHTVETKTGLSLSLLTSEDMAEMATVEVRAPVGLEKRTAPWQPIQRDGEILPTFFDTRMGNFSVKGFPTQACSTCAQSRSTTSVKLGNERCSGHFGYLSMPRKYPLDPARRSERMYVINPHLSDETLALLQAKCFFCHHFRTSAFDVERFRLGLLIADAGLVGEALNFLEVVANLRSQMARNRRTVRENERVISTEEMMREVAHRILVESGVVGTSLTSSSSLRMESANGESDSVVSAASAIRDIQTAIMEQSRQKGTDLGLASLDIRQDICKQITRELKEANKKCERCQCISPNVTSHNGHLFFHFPSKSVDQNIANGALTSDMVAEWATINARHGRNYSYFQTSEVRDHIKQLFQREHELLGAVFPRMGETTIAFPFDAPLPANMLYKVFFLDKILVPPLPVRLSSGLRVSDSGMIMPDDCTRGLSIVLKYVEQIEVYNGLCQNPNTRPTEEQERAHEHNLQHLQVKVAELYTDILESFAKKEGLFRMNMMGKRVNQACRSVISPDYLVEPNEVLLPRPFARNLTYPEQVSAHSPARVALLKRCVINGPTVYPGATHLEWRLSSGEIRFVDLHVNELQRRQHANRYFSMAQTGTLIVHRHVLDGDRLIFNRQPTLHKVSMLGYRAKVLSGLKTLRFHYVNGKSYNADFDGDEMNIHVPQSIEARAELECLMDADLNYLVPTSGKPIRGLIQDHLVAAVLLTTRDKFFDRDAFTQLAFIGLSPYLLRQSAGAVTLSDLLPIPAILKPRPLWTGKQLVSVIIKFVTGAFESGANRRNRKQAQKQLSPIPAVPTTKSRRSGLNLRAISLIQPNVYTHTNLQNNKLVVPTGSAMDDDRVLLQQSELLTGVLDKNQLGPSNLSIPHLIHEVYGAHMVGTLFGAIGRVLTVSLQREGFSIGMDDMTLVLEERRSKLLEELDLAPLRMSEADGADEAKVMPHIMNLATQLQKEFVPGRLLMPFPTNQLLMMTVSGAKGSNTNAIQMALGLGQQLFDGRRVSPMNSGKTLPPFFIGDRRSRSFGYAMGRFSSGIRPAEYTIHAMAGRDGLIDTAVKTSRSGHLQRCLIKGLESLIVHWDHSVRDANGAIIQFLYGGDGLDPVKASTLQAWEVVKDNTEDLARRFGIDAALGHMEDAGGDEGGAAEVVGEKRIRLDEELAAVLEQRKAELHRNAHQHPLPTHLKKSLHSYLTKDSTPYTLFKKVSQVERWAKKGMLAERLEEKRRDSVAFYEDVVGDITTYKRARAFCDAGEPVGLLAAQAAGEPSTQMTLNTFHSAGSTVTHVTEGIPRLRELLIHASVKKAAVIVPVQKALAADEVAISRAMRAGPAVRFADCLARGSVEGGPVAKGYRYHVLRSDSGVVYTISLLFSFSALKNAQESMCMSPKEHMTQSYLVALRDFAKRVVTVLSGGSSTGGGGNNGEGAAEGVDDDDDAHAGGPLRTAVKNPEALNDDDDDESVDSESKAARRHRHNKKSEKSRHHSKKRRLDEDDEEDDDDDDVSSSSSDDDGASDKSSFSDEEEVDDDEELNEAEAAGIGRKRRRIEDDVEEELEVENKKSSSSSSHKKKKKDRDDEDESFSVAHVDNSSATSYNKFSPIHASFRSNRYQVLIEPSTSLSSELPSDLFIVEMRISTREQQVAVVPDVLEGILEHFVMPSWLPQFESVSFTRKAEDEHSGEMVFQGPNATLENVLNFLSFFTVGTSGAIKVEKARSTNIHHMVQTLGVESGYHALLDELTKLFKRYAVDYHHLTLIADAATNRGRWESFNFTGIISHSTSPLFQMTFASSKKFLHTALTRGVGDDLRSFSASIITGERPRVGTACVKVMANPTLLSDVVERQFSL